MDKQDYEQSECHCWALVHRMLRSTLGVATSKAAQVSPYPLRLILTQFTSSYRCYYLRIENAEGYVLIAVYLFIYLYACYSQN